MKIIIGVDPDSKAHGVAKFVDGKLIELSNLTLMQLIEKEIVNFKSMHEGKTPDIKFAIENVSSNGFIYSRNERDNKKVQSKIAMSIGACQQSQVELMRMLDYFKIPYSLHKPTVGNWAKHKSKFEKITGWTGRSNEDTRSAAFFGFLAASKSNR